MDTHPEDLVSALEADLSALAAADADLERDTEVAERTRVERASISLADRLRGATGRVGLVLRGGAHPSGTVEDVGDGWVLVLGPRGESLVTLCAVLTVTGLGRAARFAGPLDERSITSVLRGWCRDRSEAALHLVDGTTVRGVVAAAYADHVDVTTECGVPVAVPLEAVAVVTR